MDAVTFPAPGERVPDFQPDSMWCLYLGEQHRSGNLVTRASQGVLAVILPETPILIEVRHERCIADGYLILDWESAGDGESVQFELRVTPAEARSLAAALIRGAEKVEFR